MAQSSELPPPRPMTESMPRPVANATPRSDHGRVRVDVEVVEDGALHSGLPQQPERAGSTCPASSRPASETTRGRVKPRSRASSPMRSMAPPPNTRRVGRWKSKGVIVELARPHGRVGSLRGRRPAATEDHSGADSWRSRTGALGLCVGHESLHGAFCGADSWLEIRTAESRATDDHSAIGGCRASAPASARRPRRRRDRPLRRRRAGRRRSGPPRPAGRPLQRTRGLTGCSFRRP